MHKLLAALLAGTAMASVIVPLRTRVPLSKGSDEWTEAQQQHTLDPKRSAIIICDMWDKHWCRGATERVNALVPRMEALLAAARRAGVLIVHAPSDTMSFYVTAPQRKAAMETPRVKPAIVRQLSAPPLPIDDSDGGCDTGDAQYKAWTRQHPGLTIATNDIVSDNGEEIYSVLKSQNRTELFIMGVHTNMCILNRSFAIRQMTQWGMRCILVRDLTDAMYDPKDRPFVSHQEGTELVIRYIEKHWAPTVLSKDLITALR